MKIFRIIFCVLTSLCINTITGFSTSVSSSDSITLNTVGAVYSGAFVEIPVFLSSQSVTHSLDFAFRYDESRLTFDTVLVLIPGLQHLYFINPDDSVFRFTSNSLNPVSTGTPFVIVRFLTAAYEICDYDIFQRGAWINGDAAGLYTTGCLASGINQLNINPLSVKIYPNPASTQLCIDHPAKAFTEILSLDGVVLKKLVSPGCLDVNGLPVGSYLLRLTTDTNRYSRRIVISR